MKFVYLFSVLFIAKLCFLGSARPMKGLLGRTKSLVSKPAPSGATMHDKAKHHAHERTVHEDKAKELFRTPANRKAHQAIADGHNDAHNKAMADIDAHNGVTRY